MDGEPGYGDVFLEPESSLGNLVRKVINSPWTSDPRFLRLTWCQWANSKYHHENFLHRDRAILNGSRKAAPYLLSTAVPTGGWQHLGRLLMLLSSTRGLQWKYSPTRLISDFTSQFNILTSGSSAGRAVAKVSGLSGNGNNAAHAGLLVCKRYSLNSKCCSLSSSAMTDA
jgi:hypothetical protein